MSNDRRDADAQAQHHWPSGTEQQGAQQSPFTRSAPAANLFRTSGSDQDTEQRRPEQPSGAQSGAAQSGGNQQARPQMQTTGNRQPSGQQTTNQQASANEATAKHRPVPATPSHKPGGAVSTSNGSTAASTASAERAGTERAGKEDRNETRPSSDKGRRTRKARLRLSRIDPWSVMKTALLFSIAFGIISVVAVAVIWQIIMASGALDSINKAAQALLGSQGQEFDLGRYVNGGRVIGFTALIAVPEVIIFTALATLFSFLYNLSATVLGGLEVTLAED